MSSSSTVVSVTVDSTSKSSAFRLGSWLLSRGFPVCLLWGKGLRGFSGGEASSEADERLSSSLPLEAVVPLSSSLSSDETSALIASSATTNCTQQQKAN